MYFETQKFLVVGMSRSGISAANILLSRGAKTFIYDEKPSPTVEKNMNALREKGAFILTSNTVAGAEERIDVLVLSPGVPIDHSLPVAFRKAGKRIIGEMELGAMLLPCPCVAITGTNGKTTVVEMTQAVLTQGGKQAVACGNVGRPVCDVIRSVGEKEVAVMEVSSFQLETLSTLCPHVAVELNISEDHLNRHYSMKNYVFLKEKLLKNSTESEYAVLNYDDETVRGFSANTKAKVVWFSLREKVDGAYYADGELYWKDRPILPASDLLTTGRHNIANALACICIAELFGVEESAIAEGLRAFKGVRHRIEAIGQVGGVKFVNDSKATNVSAALQGIESVNGEIILLLGGKDKGYDYDTLFEKLREGRVVHAVLYGENRYKLFAAAEKAGFRQLTLLPDFTMAVRVASMIAKVGQTVLLSPASASFDEFSGYEERGDRFTALVDELKKSENGGETYDLHSEKQEE